METVQHVSTEGTEGEGKGTEHCTDFKTIVFLNFLVRKHDTRDLR